MEEKARIIQELVPGKQVTIAHLIAHPDEDLAKKMGVPGAEAVGILTLSPREAAMIAGDFATKAASVQIGFVDRFTGKQNPALPACSSTWVKWTTSSPTN